MRSSLGQLEEDVLQRTRDGDQLGEGHAVLGGHLPHDLGRGAGHQQRAVLLGFDGVALLAQQPRQPVGLARAHARRRTVGAAQNLVERAAGAEHAVRDHDHVVDALGDLRQQVARHEHGPPARPPRRGPGRASSGCRAGRGRWTARRGSAPRDRPAARRRSRAAGACPSSSPSRAGRRRRSARPARAPRPRARAGGCRRRRARAGGCGRCDPGWKLGLLEHGADMARSGAAAARSEARRRWRCRRWGGSGRAGCAGSCSCRRRWGRGSRSRDRIGRRTRGP